MKTMEDQIKFMDCLFLNEISRGYGIGEQLINRIKKEA